MQSCISTVCQFKKKINMGTATFQQNTALRIDGRSFVMLRKVGDDLWQLEETKTKRIHEKTDAELRALYTARTLEFELDEDGSTDRKGLKIGKPNLYVPEALMEEAKLRRTYALAAMDLPASREAIEAVATATWINLGKPLQAPHWTTVYRWRKKLINAGRDIHGVVSKVAKKGNRKRRYPEEVLTIVELAIESVYLTREKRRCKTCSTRQRSRSRRKTRYGLPRLNFPSRRFAW